MRFLADRAERHCAGREALYDLLGRLDFFNQDRPLCFSDLQQAAQRRHAATLFVDQVRIFLKCFEARLSHRMLQLADCQRIEQVVLTVCAEMIAPSSREF